MQNSSQTNDLAFLSLTELSELIRSRKVSPVEVTRNILERIEKLQPALNAYITVTRDVVRRCSQSLGLRPCCRRLFRWVGCGGCRRSVLWRVGIGHSGLDQKSCGVLWNRRAQADIWPGQHAGRHSFVLDTRPRRPNDAHGFRYGSPARGHFRLRSGRNHERQDGCAELHGGSARTANINPGWCGARFLLRGTGTRDRDADEPGAFCAPKDDGGYHRGDDIRDPARK